MSEIAETSCTSGSIGEAFENQHSMIGATIEIATESVERCAVSEAQRERIGCSDAAELTEGSSKAGARSESDGG